MSVPQSRAIRTAVTELLRGSIGTTRTVPGNLFEPGVFTGQPVPAQQSKTIDYRFKHRFDLKVSSIGTHEATPISNTASYRLSRMRIEIAIATRLFATPLEDQREDQRAQIEGDCDTVIQALGYRNNLLATSAGFATGIVSGMLTGPEGNPTPTWEVVEEDWTQHILRSRIVGEAAVQFQQAVA